MSQKCRERSKGKDIFLTKMSAILATVHRKREDGEVALWLLASRTTDGAAVPCADLGALPLPLHSLWGWDRAGAPPAQPRGPSDLPLAGPAAGAGGSLVARVSRVLSSEKSWGRVKRRLMSKLKVVKLRIGGGFAGQPPLTGSRGSLGAVAYGQSEV